MAGKKGGVKRQDVKTRFLNRTSREEIGRQAAALLQEMYVYIVRHLKLLSCVCCVDAITNLQRNLTVWVSEYARKYSTLYFQKFRVNHMD